MLFILHLHGYNIRMTKFITGLTPQPNFPREDLTADNALLLELLIANPDLAQVSHQVSEELSWVFRVGHPAILQGMQRLYDDPTCIGAINNGVMMFETTTAMVAATPKAGDWIKVIRNGSELATRSNSNTLNEQIEDAVADFRRDLPLTGEVIAAASERFFPQLTAYSLLGAALSYQFEQSSV